MADETKHGTPTPPGENRPGGGPRMECAEFEGLLSAVLDDLDNRASGIRASGIRASDDTGIGGLASSQKDSFDAHRRVCGVCGPLFEEVQAGQQWLRSLEMVEPPANLVHNILVSTTGVLSTRPAVATRDGRTTPFGERMRERWDSFFTPLAAFVKQPRFAMSFGMIFFSFSLALSAAGVKASDVARVDLRPTALRHAYIDAEIKVVKYYDNIRFVYEIESKLRELKRANTPAEPVPAGQKEQKEKNKDNSTRQPDEKQDRNYSQDYDQPVLAALREASPAVTAITNRRFV